MTRTRGRSPRGERLVAKVPHGHWTTTTLVAALDVTGIRCSMQIEGAIDADSFGSFVEQVLAPTLTQGDIVVRRLIEARGATLVYLPPYSPDFNPIELAFSKIKQSLRSLGARTKTALWGAMQGVLNRVTPCDATGFFRHCGLLATKS
jgi:transposase